MQPLAAVEKISHARHWGKPVKALTVKLSGPLRDHHVLALHGLGLREATGNGKELLPQLMVA